VVLLSVPKAVEVVLSLVEGEWGMPFIFIFGKLVFTNLANKNRILYLHVSAHVAHMHHTVVKRTIVASA
jgi:hypothetical protein